ncbi:hypothetical protein HXX76_007349 [Chlamydomonas incerta]|uniref:Uncharacterized protein n=1 Tax=Chlamydomonas incerta TaxID=51695 RepID=A0A835T0W4_CHLIN|nr:hypothetical protein HXX76_007349 [Chlamydomonas incerta]|eukprot:KAG2435271.1 hypothetical protein HXX76_007349 [Chlamydomonas incerta]
MPKVRDRARIGQEFAVLPWQQRHEEKEVPADALYSVQSVNLFAPSGTELPCEAGKADAGPSDEDVTEEPEDGLGSGGWITKDVTSAQLTPTRRRDATLTAAGPAPVLRMVLHEPAATLQYAPGAGGDTELASGSDAETQPQEQAEEDEAEADASDSAATGPPELVGLCQLAITPSGRGMGHIIITGGPGVADDAHASGGVGAAVLVLGVATRPVEATEEPDPCFADESFDLLRLRLTHIPAGGTRQAGDGSEAQGSGPGPSQPAAAAAAAKRGRSSGGRGPGHGSGGGRGSGGSMGRGLAVEVLVSRTGGDMARLTAPPEEWLVRRTLGDHALALMRQRQRQQQRAQRRQGVRHRSGGDGAEQEEDGDPAGAGAGYCYSSDSEGEPLLDPRLDPFIAQGLGLALIGTQAEVRRRRRRQQGVTGGGGSSGGGPASRRRRVSWGAGAEAEPEVRAEDDEAGTGPGWEGRRGRAAAVKRQRTAGGGQVASEEEDQEGLGHNEDAAAAEEEGQGEEQGVEGRGATDSEEEESGSDAGDEGDIELSFQPETLLSGGAALARMADFARPLLPRRLRLAAAAAAGPAEAGVKVEAEVGAGAGGKGVEAQGGAGGTAGGQEEEDRQDEEWEEAVVCVGPVHVRGLPRSWWRHL